MRELSSRVEQVDHDFTPQVVNDGGGNIDTGNIDLKGADGCTFLLGLAAEHASDTLSATNHYAFTLTHADDNGTGSPGSYTAVATTDVVNPPEGSDMTSGIVLKVDSAAKAGKRYKCSYVGGKRFVKLTVSPEGTLTNGSAIDVDVVKTHLHVEPGAANAS